MIRLSIFNGLLVQIKQVNIRLTQKRYVGCLSAGKQLSVSLLLSRYSVDSATVSTIVLTSSSKSPSGLYASVNCLAPFVGVDVTVAG